MLDGRGYNNPLANPNPDTSRLKRTAGPGRPKGSKNRLKREEIEREVRRLMLLDPVKVYERYKDPATGKLRRTFTLKEVHEMDPDTRACIASIKVRTENLKGGDGAQDETVEIRFWDKVRALELGARALGMLKDTVVVEGLDDRKARLRAALAQPKRGRDGE